jgi:hypothetical protein
MQNFIHEASDLNAKYGRTDKKLSNNIATAIGMYQ